MGIGMGVFALVEYKLTAPVIVHEWGTFTSLQDETGRAIGGINVDDEPVPNFVCQFANRLVAAQYSNEQGNFGLPPYNADGGKGWTNGDPTVTMRLETPVLYFYPPKGESPEWVPPLDVHVDFHGGVLSQYYPYAQANGVVFNGDIPYLEKRGITDTMMTGLTWKSVRLGSTGIPVETDDRVWTTPREVSAPLIEVSAPIYDNKGKHEGTQAEHFLFYRGVGHLDSPIFVAPDGSKIKGSMEMGSLTSSGVDEIDSAWIVEIRPDGSCAARQLTSTWMHPVGTSTNHLMTDGAISGFFTFPNFSAAFSDSDFSPDSLTKLKASMQDALIKEGLYPDEASAMLRTWELSYFKSPGLRFFYIVPRKWVDQVLPLRVTGAPTEITRVMVGRIELITDGQRAALARLAAGPCPDLAAIKKSANDALENGKLSKDDVAAFYRGEKPLSDLGIAIPPLVQDYLSLGRFRDALIVHEEREHPSPALAQFIKDNQLTTQEN
jgi:hypothetical protein